MTKVLYPSDAIPQGRELRLIQEYFLVACAVRDHNVDPRQIFTMGCSAGGLFAASMAALRSSYVAAAAPNSGGWVKTPTFQDSHKPALMTVHGAMGKDVVIVDFAERSAIADAAFKMQGSFVIDCDTGGSHCAGSSLAGQAWEFFQKQPPGYQRICRHYVTSAKQEATRERRLQNLVKTSAEGRRLDQFISPPGKK